MSAYLPQNQRSIESYEQPHDGGVAASLERGDILACFDAPYQAKGRLHEPASVVSSGQRVGLELLTGAEAQEYEPHLSNRVVVAVKILSQRYLTPPRYVTAL